MEKIKSKKRIILFTQWFDPEPALKGLNFARKLQNNNYEVEVLTGFPNYPGGKIYDGYRLKLFQKECIEQIKIHRVFLYPSHDEYKFKRILNYISFAISAFIYFCIFIRKANILYVYHPPLTVGIAAAAIKFLFRIPVVIDIQDMWPDSLTATGIIRNKLLIKIIFILCKLIYKICDQIIVLSPGFKKLLIKRGVKANKINIIYNWSVSKFKNKEEIKKIKIGTDGKFHILFAGNIGKAQSLDVICKVAQKIQKSLEKVEFILLGGGIELDKIKRLSQKLALNNIKFKSRVSPEKATEYLNSADVLLVHLRKNKLFEITIPSKTQSYMEIGKPILMAVNGDAASLVKKSKSGIIANSSNVKDITNAVEKLYLMSQKELNELGLNGKKFYDRNLSIDCSIKKFIKVFNKI